MAVFIVTWNLNKERSNYDSARRAFIGKIELYDNTSDPALESVRWVSSSSTAEQISETLMSVLDDNDRVFISRLNLGEHQGWLSNDVWRWINARL